MDSWAGSRINHANLNEDYLFVEGVAYHIEDGNYEQIPRSHSSYHSSKCHQHCCHCVWAQDQSIDVPSQCPIEPSPLVLESMGPEPMQERVGLRDEGVDEEGVGESAPGVTPDEGHQEAETDEHHHIYILKAGVSLRLDGVSWIGELIPNEDPHKDDEDDFKDKHEDSKTPERILLLLKVSVDLGLSGHSFLNFLFPIGLVNHFEISNCNAL